MSAHGTSVAGACSSIAGLLQLGSQAGKCLSSSSCGDLRRALQRLAAAVMWRDGVPMPQVVKDTLETMENTPKERISECTPGQFFDAFDEPVLRFQDDPMVKQKLQAEAKEIVNTRSEKSESRAESAHDRQNCCDQRYKFDQAVSDDGKEWAAAFLRSRRISRKGKTVSRPPVLRWKCGLFPRSASRSVHRASMCIHEQTVDQPGDQAGRDPTWKGSRRSSSTDGSCDG